MDVRGFHEHEAKVRCTIVKTLSAKKGPLIFEAPTCYGLGEDGVCCRELSICIFPARSHLSKWQPGSYRKEDYRLHLGISHLLVLSRHYGNALYRDYMGIIFRYSLQRTSKLKRGVKETLVGALVV